MAARPSQCPCQPNKQTLKQCAKVPPILALLLANSSSLPVDDALLAAAAAPLSYRKTPQYNSGSDYDGSNGGLGRAGRQTIEACFVVALVKPRLKSAVSAMKGKSGGLQ